MQSSCVPRKVEVNWKDAVSPAGGRSGTSGTVKHTHEWISARLNCPVSVRVLRGLPPQTEHRITYITHRVKHTHEWISAKLNCPVSFRVLRSLPPQTEHCITYITHRVK